MNYLVLAGIALFIFSILLGFSLREILNFLQRKQKTDRAKEIVLKAQREANDIRYNARRDAKEIIRSEKRELEKEIKSKENELRLQEKEMAKKELTLDQRIEELQKEKNSYQEKMDDLNQYKKRVDVEIAKYKQIQQDLADSLVKISGMTAQEAKEELIKTMEEEAKVDFAKKFRELAESAQESAEKNAKKIISTAISRFAGEFIAEKSIDSVSLPSDDIKGRLIGREGRNIRAFEQICGVDLIIDDTPEVVVISSFNAVRREMARLTIIKLIADGRIHPAKIEEFYEKSKIEIDNKLRDLGEKAQMELGLHGMHPEVLKLVGALNLRTSYTQNQYQHALETAYLAGAMAAELNINVKQARRAGLLHDIGKVLDASLEGSHAQVGANFLKRYGESPDIVHAVRAHHEEITQESILAFIVSAADALSGARPGARKAMMESYISRLTDIEEIINSFPGVAASYAISGGREVRVLVNSEKVSDDQTVMLSNDIAKKIEEEMSYPGTIKVTVIRELKAIGIAR